MTGGGGSPQSCEKCLAIFNTRSTPTRLLYLKMEFMIQSTDFLLPSQLSGRIIRHSFCSLRQEHVCERYHRLVFASQYSNSFVGSGLLRNFQTIVSSDAGTFCAGEVMCCQNQDAGNLWLSRARLASIMRIRTGRCQ
jgi:hypothetical protein